MPSAPRVWHRAPGTGSLVWGRPGQVHERTSVVAKLFSHVPGSVTPVFLPLSKRVPRLNAGAGEGVCPLAWAGGTVKSSAREWVQGVTNHRWPPSPTPASWTQKSDSPSKAPSAAP